MYAVKFGEPNFLLSERVNENSKVLYYREPLERVEKLAPWLTLDEDPYPAVIDGRIVWIVDGYTTTDRYPLAQSGVVRGDDRRLARRRVGVRHAADRRDQLHAQRGEGDRRRLRRHASTSTRGTSPTRSCRRGGARSPARCRTARTSPTACMEHLRYPEDLFKVQRYQFARYHVTDAGDFYQGNNRWEVPQDPEAPGQLPAAVPPVRQRARRDG